LDHRINSLGSNFFHRRDAENAEKAKKTLVYN
jgi:hypothetical protein